jgi:hypothetical protein
VQSKSPSSSLAGMGKPDDPHTVPASDSGPLAIAQIRSVVHVPPGLQGTGLKHPSKVPMELILDLLNQRKSIVKKQHGRRPPWFYPHDRPRGGGICRTTCPTFSPQGEESRTPVSGCHFWWALGRPPGNNPKISQVCRWSNDGAMRINDGVCLVNFRSCRMHM